MFSVSQQTQRFSASSTFETYQPVKPQSLPNSELVIKFSLRTEFSHRNGDNTISIAWKRY